MIKNRQSLFFAHKNNTILIFPIILEYIIHSNCNREALTLHKCVNNGTSAQVMSSAGIFDETTTRGQ